jgi:o-succinylbenzoate synthase
MKSISNIHRQLHFKQPARTSRGAYSVRDVWYVKIRSDKHERWGIGECAPLPDLSCDALPDYERILADACRNLEQEGQLNVERLRPYPSILFGLETAVRHFETGSFALWDTPFSRGETGIPINGLIWMSDYPNMLKQVETKIAAGFRCIKLKIGAIGFEEELDLLRFIRNHFPANELQLRVDANGAFSPKDAPDKLIRLAELDIHSIEQPICAGQWEAMAQLAAQTPVPIALDEELIGVHRPEDKRRLLNTIRPQYIILKPSLHGSFCGCDEWIEEAGKLGIGWWMTSALESNIGLNAIAQKCATFDNPVPQGLGTGQLFTDNVDLPLFVRKDCLWFLKQNADEADFR